MSRSPLGVALVGYGFMGAAHSQAWRVAPRFFDLPFEPRMSVIVGRDRARVGAAAERFGWDEAENDWRRAIERDDVGLVDICSPGATHVEIAIAALEAGKHVLCEKPLANTVAEAELMTEFGATPALEVVSRITAEADAHMTSWLWWEYREGTGLSASSNPPDAKINSDVADLLVRAYPRAISGTPQRWSFDPSAHRFTLSYSTARADGGGAFPAGALSEIYLPLRHYPHGYQVSVTGGTVASAAGASVLQIASLPEAQSVQVTVTPD